MALESAERGAKFILPSFEAERGEIERVRQHFRIFSSAFFDAFKDPNRNTGLVTLTDEVWDKLENTDSHRDQIPRNDLKALAHHAAHEKRDWQSLLIKMQTRTPLDAPIIAKRGEVFHLVSGNTRLMVARALGVRPNVLVVDITDLE